MQNSIYFIRPSFKLDILIPYFDYDARESVKTIKLDLSTCKICKQICLEYSIEALDVLNGFISPLIKSVPTIEKVPAKISIAAFAN